MKRFFQSISVTRRGCITSLFCAIPLVAALTCVFITTAVFSHDVPKLVKGFPSADYIEVSKTPVQ
ncbi:hypothetical protein B0G76_4763 [Paraburkholderia sp. BL23I1N1]|nr:hypothetical protein B0G76_4763 [Paraburkholderia sp. BL23I1N1]